MAKICNLLLVLILGIAYIQEIQGSDASWYPCPRGIRGRFCRRQRMLQGRQRHLPELQRPAQFPRISDRHCYVGAVAKCFDKGESFEDPTTCNRCYCTNPPIAACTRKACSKGCYLAGRFYRTGERFTDPRSCNRCSCGQKGLVICTLASCPTAHCRYRRAVYGIGESWTDADCCNTCHCSGDGEGHAGVICTKKACD